MKSGTVFIYTCAAHIIIPCFQSWKTANISVDRGSPILKQNKSLRAWTSSQIFVLLLVLLFLKGVSVSKGGRSDKFVSRSILKTSTIYFSNESEIVTENLDGTIFVAVLKIYLYFIHTFKFFFSYIQLTCLKLQYISYVYLHATNWHQRSVEMQMCW